MYFMILFSTNVLEMEVIFLNVYFDFLVTNHAVRLLRYSENVQGKNLEITSIKTEILRLNILKIRKPFKCIIISKSTIGLGE